MIKIKTTLLLIAIFQLTMTKGQSSYFPPLTGNNWDTLSTQSLSWCNDKIDSLYQYLSSQNTKSFILLKDGKIVLEKYFGTHTQNDAWYWASAGKTLTATMVGIAQQENFLNINDTSSKYLGKGWTSCTPEQEAKITIKNQLSMTTGLDDGVANSACTLDTCLIYKAASGTRWSYHNGPYTILDKVVENATGTTLNNYTTQKLKSKIGMTGSFVKVDYNNVYFSTARSMARFGLLILNKGKWNGNAVLTDTNYFNEMTNTSQTLNRSYGYLWWLNGKQSFMVPQSQAVINSMLSPNAPIDNISALGKNGQFINVSQSNKMVWIRMGDAPDQVDVPFLMNDKIWVYINQLNCNNTSVNQHTINKTKIYPNPSKGFINIESNNEIQKLFLYNSLGQEISQIEVNGVSTVLNYKEVNEALLVLKISYKNGDSSVHKIINE